MKATAPFRVLFVDDEPQVLSGLRRLTGELDGEWDWLFSNNGPEALLLFEQEPIDVVYSDLRMPGLTGSELLHKVQLRWPETVRIVLSGQCDQTTLLKTVPSAHQFLAKPCEADDLLASLMGAKMMASLLSDRRLRALVAKLPNLPSPPAQYHKLMAELNNPDVSMARICDVIDCDVSMTAKMLQLVNSAFFGLPRHIADVRQAASLLGIELLKSLAAQVQAFSQFPPMQGLDVERLAARSICVAQHAGRLAQAEGLSVRERELLAATAMLQDVGQIAIAAGAPALWSRIVAGSGVGGVSLEPEQMFMGTTHAEVGAYLLGIWGLPAEVVQAVASHHRPDWSESESPSIGQYIYIANGCVGFDGSFDATNILNELGTSTEPNVLQFYQRVHSWSDRTSQQFAAA